MAPLQFVCGGCLQRFHNTMNKDHKNQWNCHDCKGKQPKSGNANTDRSSNEPLNIEVTGTDNITIRKPHTKQSTTMSGTALDKDDSANVYDEDLVTAICDRVLRSIKSEIPTLLTAILQQELSPIRNELLEFRTSMDFINNKYEEINQEYITLKNENAALVNTCKKLECTVRDLSERLNNTEQYLRENNLEIQGVPEHRDKLNTSLLGIAGEKSPVYISEHLSPANKNLHAAARKKAKSLNYQFVWVRGGRIFVRKSPESTHIHIKTQESLDLIR
ncbi:hypothetical protein ACJJTC_014025 [Scirpophaga incertulas]